MAFKSVNFLERHRKYSELHQSNVNQIKEKEEAKAKEKEKKDKEDKEKDKASNKLLLSPLTPPPHKLFPAEQVEGTHYRLLYSGTKLFWRTQKALEFEFYHHVLPHTIEVAAFDYEKHLEVGRLYLDYTVVADAVEPAVREAADRHLKDLTLDRFADAPDLEALCDDLRRHKIISYILARLQQESGTLCVRVLLTKIT